MPDGIDIAASLARSPAPTAGNSASARVERWLPWALAMAVPGYFAAVTVLRQFYLQGGLFLDAGVFVGLLWHSGWTLMMPPATTGISYLATHFVPLFLPLTCLSWALPLTGPQYLAFVIGCGYGLVGLGVYMALARSDAVGGAAPTALRVAVSIAFALSGIPIVILLFPHTEIITAGAIILFFAALKSGRTRIALAAFGLALSSREDAGLHIFAIVAVHLALDRLTGRSSRTTNRFALFGAVALAYSTLILLAQRWFFPGDSALMRVYLGHPLWSHLTRDLMVERLSAVIVGRAYLTLPLIVAAAWAIRTRNPYILVGYLAALPWTVLNLTAVADIPGMLSGYYGFPLLIAQFWPLLAINSAVARPDAARTGIRTPLGDHPLTLFALMIAVSLAGLNKPWNPGQTGFGPSSLFPPGAPLQAATESAVTRLLAGDAALGRLMVDTGVAALRPLAVSRDQLLQSLAEWPDRTADTILYFPQSMDGAVARARIQALGLDRHYAVKGTALLLATRLPLQSSPIADLLDEPEEAASLPAPRTVRPTEGG